LGWRKNGGSIERMISSNAVGECFANVFTKGKRG
jgi:hypothetical protein